MIGRIAAGGLIALTMACATAAPQAPLPAHASGRCNTVNIQDLIGREATQALAIEAQRRSDAHRVRWLPPGAIVTMDYSPDRLNIEYDARMRVTALRCG